MSFGRQADEPKMSSKRAPNEPKMRNFWPKKPFSAHFRLISGSSVFGGRPWRGSVKIEPGFFFQVFFFDPKNPVKTRKKKPVKPGKTCWKMWRVRRKLGIW